MITLNIGDVAPTFTTTDQTENTISLTDFLGKIVVLYFYPQDDTPVCTKEACNLRDNYETLSNHNIVVLGVSPDDAQKHQKFISKYQLPFTLLADTDKNIINLYGVWGEKNMYGNKVMGILRSTFIINEEGKIVHIFKKVDSAKHSDQILKKLGLL